MKTVLVSALFFFLSNVSFGQSTLLGFKLSVGNTLTRVRDLDHAPSDGLDSYGYLRNPADGFTTKVNNRRALSLGVNLDLPASETFYLSTGLWFTSKSIHISNQDGGYYGQSIYNITYLQIPLAAKFYIKDVAPDLDLFFKAGITLDVKVRENLQGGDGAHFWNLAKMRTDPNHGDPSRGKNGDYEVKALFSPFNLGILGSFGAEYSLGDFILFGALSYNAGLLNTINPSLKHDDFNKTRVGSNLKIATSIFSLDMGIILPLDL